MYQGSVEVSIEKKKEGLNRKESIELKENRFLKGRKSHKDECNKQAT